MRIKAMSNLDRMIELASHGTSRAQGQAPAGRELKDVPVTEEPTQEAVGEFAEPLYTLQDELGLEDNILVDELARWMDGQDITEFVKRFRQNHEMDEDQTEESVTNEATGVCKDCGCEIDNCKPGCDCPNDSHDASGDHWVAEESLEEDSNKELALKDWYQNWSRYTGGNGDELPKGWFRAELDSGITTDGIEQSELDMNWEEDRLPITDAMKDDFKSIMGNDDEETLRIAYDICSELWEAVTEAKAKPDFADIDGDGDKDEDMKKAAKDMKKEELEESPTMDTTQLINLMKNSGLSEEAIETKLTEWANTPDGAAEEEATSHGEPYENFAQSVNLSLKRYLDAEDMKVGLKEHTVADIKEAYKKSKGE